jgi:hypothetical protein
MQATTGAENVSAAAGQSEQGSAGDGRDCTRTGDDVAAVADEPGHCRAIGSQETVACGSMKEGIKSYGNGKEVCMHARSAILTAYPGLASKREARQRKVPVQVKDA